MRIAIALFLLTLSGCALSTPDVCPTGQQPLQVDELFFGRNIKGHAPVTDAQWQAFADDVLAKQFPDGFTVTEAMGSWHDPATGQTVHEPSKVVTIAAPSSRPLAAAIDSVTAAYRTMFHQSSVGIISRDACGAF
jgi:hypothetical protein